MDSELLRVLYVGDIMGRPGREIVGQLLPEIRQQYQVDVVIAQAENVTHGVGMSAGHMRELQQMGVHFFTGGNHSLARRSLWPLLADPSEPVLAPVNHPQGEPKWGAKLLATPKGNVLIASVLGTIFPQLEGQSNPLMIIDELLASHQTTTLSGVIINFHGDFSSEKRVIGMYVDGRASVVIGDHWHVPTADAAVLPGGTAHITDVGMCGTLYSSIGVSKEVIIGRWRDNKPAKNEIAEEKPYQFNALLVAIDTKTRLAVEAELIQRII